MTVLKNINRLLDDIRAVPHEHRSKGKKPNALKNKGIYNTILLSIRLRKYIYHNLTSQENAMESLLYYFHHQTQTNVFTRDSSLHVKVHMFPCWRFHLLKKLGWNVCPLYSISKPRDNVRQICDCFRKHMIDAVTEEEKLAATEMFHKH